MVSRIGAILAAIALISLALSGPGTRWRWWDFRVGLLLFAAAGLFGLIAAILGLAGRRGALPGSSVARASGFAIAAGLGALVLPAYGLITARRVPSIHDIATDVEDPPQFRAALTVRGDRSNPAPPQIDPDVVRQQRAAYPDLGSVLLRVPPEEALVRAADVARSLRWHVLSVNTADGTVEATATTAWFGFRDDVVIRVRPAEGGSRVDVRSTSRVGRSDAGANAGRIRRFLRVLQSRR
ncbi:MAG TPA: DUF1499 domain-containing protein [Thermoanaerobaculia bacterium]|nr:DUF1499 domain-containing protein [Thermoanaerobaculia bacterium]